MKNYLCQLMWGCSKVQILVPAQSVNLHVSLKKGKKSWIWIVWKWWSFSWSLIAIEILKTPFLGEWWGSPLTCIPCGNKSKQGTFDCWLSLTKDFPIIGFLFHVWKKADSSNAGWFLCTFLLHLCRSVGIPGFKESAKREH